MARKKYLTVKTWVENTEITKYTSWRTKEQNFFFKIVFFHQCFYIRRNTMILVQLQQFFTTFCRFDDSWDRSKYDSILAPTSSFAIFFWLSKNQIQNYSKLKSLSIAISLWNYTIVLYDDYTNFFYCIRMFV